MARAKRGAGHTRSSSAAVEAIPRGRGRSTLGGRARRGRGGRGARGSPSPLPRSKTHSGFPSFEFIVDLDCRLCGRPRCNTPATPGPAPVTPGSSLGSLDWPHKPTLVFSAHFVLTRAHPGMTSRSVTHPQITPGQARLTSEFFSYELPEKKLQLVGMSILLILLSHEPGSHTIA